MLVIGKNIETVLLVILLFCLSPNSFNPEIPTVRWNINVYVTRTLDHSLSLFLSLRSRHGDDYAREMYIRGIFEVGGAVANSGGDNAR